jgi:ribosomal protein S18 acetylase RimI-like enzyme
VQVRPYLRSTDYDAVGRMLLESYRPGPVYDPWLQPRWEYMHFHPLIRGHDLRRFGVAESHGDLRGIVHFEHDPAVSYIQRRSEADDVIGPLLDWAGQHLGGPSETFGRDILGIYVPDFDVALRRAVEQRGFTEHPEHVEANSRLTDIARLPVPAAPPGYEVRSLADENDLDKVHRVLWRGFDHEGPPPVEGVEERRFMQSAPNFRPDLTIVVVDPAGEYASFCGMWVVPDHRIAYVEPVATDPDHRRRGVGRTAVLEAARRAGVDGADVAWVGSRQAFYLSLGFEEMFECTLWVAG